MRTVYTFFLIKCTLSFDYCEYFDEGMCQRDSTDDSRGVSQKIRAKTSKTKTQKLFAAVLHLINNTLIERKRAANSFWILVFEVLGLSFRDTCKNAY